MTIRKALYTVSGVNQKHKLVCRNFKKAANARRALAGMIEGQIAYDGHLIEVKDPPRQPFKF